MQVAIVTGSYGYIGSVLSKVLKKNDYYVIGIDNDKSSCNRNNPLNNRLRYHDEFYCDDFVSDNSLDIIKRYPEATIFHLAANSLLGPSAYDPLSYYENNTAKTIKLVKTLVPTQRIVFSSTAAVYDVASEPITEESTINPPNNYGRSKLWCEQMLDSCFEILGIKATTFRFFNVIGAWDDVGQLPDTPHLINQLCYSALLNRTFNIFGDDFPTRDGTCVRDYLHVVDVARALVHSDEYMMKKNTPCHQKYNLGTYGGTTVKEIVDTFTKIAKPVNYKVIDRRKGDPPFLIANPNKFINETNFQYKYTNNNLNDMIESAWRYASNDHSV